MSFLSALLSLDDPLDGLLVEAGFDCDELGEWTRGLVRYVRDPNRRAPRHLLCADGRQPSCLQAGFAAAVTPSGIVEGLAEVRMQVGAPFSGEIATAATSREQPERHLGLYRVAEPFAPSWAWLRHAAAKHRHLVSALGAEWAVATTRERVSLMLAVPTAGGSVVVLRHAAVLLESLLGECEVAYASVP